MIKICKQGHENFLIATSSFLWSIFYRFFDVNRIALDRKLYLEMFLIGTYSAQYDDHHPKLAFHSSTPNKVIQIYFGENLMVHQVTDF